jgi:hypothetical protein
MVNGEVELRRTTRPMPDANWMLLHEAAREEFLEPKAMKNRCF